MKRQEQRQSRNESLAIAQSSERWRYQARRLARVIASVAAVLLLGRCGVSSITSNQTTELVQ
jgi:propanediol dehydratase small subunit